MYESDLLDQYIFSQYQMLIVSEQWAITLGRYDVQYATNTLSIFIQQLRDGHTNISLSMFEYLKHYLQAKIHFYPQKMNT